jgi:hypothetical protein
VQVLLDEVVRTLNAGSQQPPRVLSPSEQQLVEEAEKPYKNTIEQQHRRIEGLEGDVARGEREIALLKKERKMYTIREDISSLAKEVEVCATVGRVRGEFRVGAKSRIRATPRSPSCKSESTS